VLGLWALDDVVPRAVSPWCTFCEPNPTWSRSAVDFLSGGWPFRVALGLGFGGSVVFGVLAAASPAQQGEDERRGRVLGVGLVVAVLGVGLALVALLLFVLLTVRVT
jgi:hypothetical protein